MKLISFILVSVLFIIANCSDIVDRGHYDGKSANIILRPKKFEDTSSVYLIGKYFDSLNELDETDMGNLISHSLGVPLTNPSRSTKNLPKGNIFDKSRANLLVAVDSLIPTDASSIPKISSMAKVANLKKTSYPEDPIATLTSLSTSQIPASHGIIGKSWLSSIGRVDAYRASAIPEFGTYGDVISKSFEGRSLTMSASANFQMSSAMSVHQYLQHQLPRWNNHGFFFNYKTRQFESIYSTPLAPQLQLTSEQLKESLSKRLFEFTGAKVTFDSEAESLNVVIESMGVNAVFDLHIQEEWSLFLELEFFSALMESLNEESIQQLTKDDIPDSFSFAFSSLRGIEIRYGAFSPQAKAALYLIDSFVAKAIAQLNVVYENKLSTEILFLGNSAMESLIYDNELRMNVYYLIAPYVDRTTYDEYFPSIYLKKNVEETVCLQVQQKFDSETVEVSCFDSKYYLTQIIGNMAVSTNDTTNGTTPTDLYPRGARFNIVLWTAIVLVLIALATVYALANMNIALDSIIYRTSTKPHTN